MFTPGSILRAKRPFRVSMGYGPSNDGLCAKGELFMVSIESCDTEFELWVLNDLLLIDGNGCYSVPRRTYFLPDMIEPYLELAATSAPTPAPPDSEREEETAGENETQNEMRGPQGEGVG
jgi:hypothetical protein